MKKLITLKKVSNQWAIVKYNKKLTTFEILESFTNQKQALETLKFGTIQTHHKNK